MSTQRNDPTARRLDRRRFLGSIGVGAAGAAVAAHAGVPIVQADERAQRSLLGRFGRMFPQLGPFAEPSRELESALVEIGKPGGILDAKDDLSAGPVALIADAALSANNRNNPEHTAGTTFMGQFLDHDLTFDVGSPLGRPVRPEASENGRTAVLDLDSLYGRGPISDPQLYNPRDRAKLKVESSGMFEDLPRTPSEQAIIADPRNDENLMVAGLQLAFLLFHNRLVDDVRAGSRRVDPREAFTEARKLLLWHYHWLIVHEFLPLFIGRPLVDDILERGPRFYAPRRDQAVIPVEFQGAAYRFGHSMVRPSYRANLKGDNGMPFFGMVFDPSQEGKDDPNDLRGGCRASRRFIGWQTFFDFGDGEVKPNKRIDTRISTPLFNLPLGAIASHDRPTSLPQRTLLRHITWLLPSGQSIAREMRVDRLNRSDLKELRDFDLDLDTSTPLWYYVLKEAELMEDGLHLGPVGGRIVGEVFIGILRADPTSYLVQQPDWRPTLPSRSGSGDFRMVDLLTLAGVDPASRGQ